MQDLGQYSVSSSEPICTSPMLNTNPGDRAPSMTAAAPSAGGRHGERRIRSAISERPGPAAPKGWLRTGERKSTAVGDFSPVSIQSAASGHPAESLCAVVFCRGLRPPELSLVAEFIWLRIRQANLVHTGSRLAAPGRSGASQDPPLPSPRPRHPQRSFVTTSEAPTAPAPPRPAPAPVRSARLRHRAETRRCLSDG